LSRLKEGRLVLTYGYRRPPFGIRARISDDDGRTWTPEFVLRDDGGSWDLGYPRTLMRPDGLLVTVYYFNTGSKSERFVAATIWDPQSGTTLSAGAIPDEPRMATAVRGGPSESWPIASEQ
jgi:hypothetical protein